jgi:hypothetical protein
MIISLFGESKGWESQDPKEKAKMAEKYPFEMDEHMGFYPKPGF